MVKVLKPCYNVLSRVQFSQSLVPALYKEAQAADYELSTGQSLMIEHYQLTICQYLSALTLPVRIKANDPPLNV